MNLQENSNMSENSILLIDPFKNLLNAYRMILEEEKYLVETAINIEDAFRFLSIKQYSVIITEHILPFENTYRMIQWVKQNVPETYIIMITDAFIDEKTYGELFNIGLDDFILKPHFPEKILVHIKKGLRQRDLILKKQELERQTLLDPITQKIQKFIFSPIYFKKSLRHELKRSIRHKHPLSLILIKIPAKEKIGDNFENFCVDLAKILRSHTREEDLVGRENGSFGVILPETDQVGSQTVAKRLANLIQNYPAFQSDEFLKPIVETLSFQIFTYPEMFLIPESLMAVLEEVNEEYKPN
jgi:PleD family two-component response regulator